MRLEADLHTHSTASGHAYSTIAEIAKSASKKGLKMIAITDHGPAMPGAAHEYYFGNLRVLPQEMYGVRILKGVEANITSDGGLDLSEKRLEELDFVAAGIHGDVFDNDKNEKSSVTRALIKVIENPQVDMITHPVNSYYPVDIEEVVKSAKENKVILEVNASSYDKRRVGYRGDRELCKKMCRCALKYGTKISINSDAHTAYDVGNVDCVEIFLAETGLLNSSNVINSSVQKIKDFLNC